MPILSSLDWPTGTWTHDLPHEHANHYTTDAAQNEHDKRTNNGLQNTTQKNKDEATWTLLKTGGEFRKGMQFLLF